MHNVISWSNSEIYENWMAEKKDEIINTGNDGEKNAKMKPK